MRHRRANGLVMVKRSTEPFTMFVEVNGWVVNFRCHKGMAFVNAHNSSTNELLEAPYDNDRLAELVPFHSWPLFAHSLIRQGNQEGLFHNE